MKQSLKSNLILPFGLVTLCAIAAGATGCGENPNVASHQSPGIASNGDQKGQVPTLPVTSDSPVPSPSASASSAPSVNGFAFCESALQQLPLVAQDSLNEGTNVLSFVHFGANGAVVINQDARVKFTQSDSSSAVQSVGFQAAGRTEQIFFSYQDRKVKDVTVQHFQDGAWMRDKLTFLLSSDESTCYVQHLHSDVEVYPNPAASSILFDLETCRLAQDEEINPTEAQAVRDSGNVSKLNCDSPFAKAALNQFYQGNLTGPGSNYHKVPTPQAQ